MHKKSSLYSLLFTVFNDSIGWGVALTIFAPLVMNQSQSLVPADMSEATRNIVLGMLISSYALTQFFSMPIIGALSDSFGRKRILEWTLIGATLSFFLSAYAIWIQSLSLLFISRLLAGLFSGNSGTAQASIADMSTEKTKAKNLSLIGIVGGISWIVGPPLGGLLSTGEWLDYSTPFWLLGVLFLINLWWLNRSYIETYQTKEHHDWKQEIKDLKKLSKLPRMTGWMIVTFLFYFGWFFISTYFPTFLVLKFNFNSIEIGYISGYMSIFWLLTSLMMNRGMADKIGTERITYICLFAISIMMVLIDYVDILGWLILIPPMSFGGSVCWIATMSITSNLAGIENQGKIFGITQSMFSLALVLAPLITGMVAAYHLMIPLLIGAAVLLSGSIYAWRLSRNGLV